MWNTVELLTTCRAIEMLYKGIVITKEAIDNYDRGDAVPFVIAFDEQAKSLLEILHPYVVRSDRTYVYSEKQLQEEELSVDVNIPCTTLISTMKTLKDLKVCEYNNIDEEMLDPELQERFAEMDKSFDYTQAYGCEIKDKLTIASTDTEVKAMLALCQYESELAQSIYEVCQKPREFVLKDFENFEVVENRIIIPFSEVDKYRMKKFLRDKGISKSDIDRLSAVNAFVISKNLTDYFFCSYGNSFQSCFSLNSGYYGWYGYIPMAMADESFILYATTGDVVKTSVISGQKFHHPQMIWRAWGYATADRGLVVDKKYRQETNSNNKFIEYCCKWLTEKFGVICDSKENRQLRDLYNDGAELAKAWERNYRFYADSLQINDGSVKFAYNAGNCSVKGQFTPLWRRKHSDFIAWASNVTSIDEGLDLSKPCDIVNGTLTNLNYCPVTKLTIPRTKDKHTYAKYFDKPVTDMFAMTYVDGQIFLDGCTKFYTDAYFNVGDDCSRGFYDSCLYVHTSKSSAAAKGVALKTIKEHIKGHISSTPYDAILLRIIEDDKVTIQVFKNKGAKQ